MKTKLDIIREQWIEEELSRQKRFPKPRKPRITDTIRMSYHYDVPANWAPEFDEYLRDAVQMFLDNKTQ